MSELQEIIRSIAEKQANIEKSANKEKQTDTKKQADVEKRTDIEKQVGVEKQTDTKKQADVEKQTNTKKQADIEKQTDIEKQVDQKYFKMMEYKESILEINKMVNITRITDSVDFDRKHFIDSLSCCDSPEFLDAKTVIDIGSGGGFPGVPLAVMFPEKDFLLLDSSAKRMRIVQEITSDLGISNVRTLHGRAEELGRDPLYREKYDLCVSRAVASLATLCEYCIPFVCPGGSFISFKGPGSDEEISSSYTAIGILGGRMDRIVDNTDTMFSVTGNEGHRLVYIRKENRTPDKYPRGGGKPSKKPL